MSRKAGGSIYLREEDLKFIQDVIHILPAARIFSIIHSFVLVIVARQVVLEGQIFHKGIKITHLVVRDADFAFYGLHVVEADFQVNAQGPLAGREGAISRSEEHTS